jgi:hypothetical protein
MPALGCKSSLDLEVESRKGDKASSEALLHLQNKKALNGWCRCQVDKSEVWQMVCGKCWNQVSHTKHCLRWAILLTCFAPLGYIILPIASSRLSTAHSALTISGSTAN